MTQPPYAGPPVPPPFPPAPPPGRPGRPVRRRPSAWWFAVAGVLLVLAPVVFVGGLVWTLRPLNQTDAVFSADGRPHRLTLPAHEQRALFRPASAVSVSCLIADEDGDEVQPRGVSGSYTTTHDGVEYRAGLQFDTGDGVRIVTCTLPTGLDPVDLRVGAVPATSTLVLGILVSIAAPMVLGLAGLAVLLVTVILWTRRPTDRAGGASYG